jgi:hypothetical protein
LGGGVLIVGGFNVASYIQEFRLELWTRRKEVVGNAVRKGRAQIGWYGIAYYIGKRENTFP